MNIFVEQISLTVRNTSIIRNISFTIPDGHFTCIVGANGSGKSSIMRIISKDITNYSGFVTDIRQDQMVYLPQNIRSPLFLKTIEIVHLGFYGQKLTIHEKNLASEKLLDTFGINHIKNTSFTDISAGEKQRTWLAFALAQSKNLMLLDEPLADIDIKDRKRFYGLLRSIVDEGNTLALITHDIDLVLNFCNHMIVLEKGEKIFEGNPANFELNDSIAELRVHPFSTGKGI